MLKRVTIVILLFTISLIGIACNKPKEQVAFNEAAIPETVQQQFLYLNFNDYTDYEEDRVNFSIKSLKDKKAEFVAENVQASTITHVNDGNIIFYIDDDENLYKVTDGKDPVQIEQDVLWYDVSVYDHSKVIFSDEDNNIFLLQDDEVIRLASDVNESFLIDDSFYFTDDAGDLKQYDIDEDSEIEIATDVDLFKILGPNGSLVYAEYEGGSVYYIDEVGASPQLIADEYIYLNSQFEKIDNYLIYLEEEDDTENLVTVDLNNNMEKIIIAEEVVYYEYEKTTGKIYYLTEDDGLFMTSLENDKPEEIATDVYSFTTKDKGAYFYESIDEGKYFIDSKGKESYLGGEEITYADLTESGDIFYTTENDELFVNDNIITQDLYDFSYIYGHLAYATTNNELYLMENMKEAVLIDKDLSDVDYVYYQNELIFEKELTLADIAGIWVEDEHFIEIYEDGTITDYRADTSIEHTVTYAAPVSLSLTDEYDYVIDIERMGDDEIIVDEQDIYYYMHKTTNKELKKFLSESQTADVHFELDRLIGYYTHHTSEALNTGDTDSLHNYIDEDSPFYEEEIARIEVLHDTGFLKEFFEYEIINVKQVDPGEYRVTVEEYFMMYDPTLQEDEYNEVTNVYTVVDGSDGLYYVSNVVER